MPIARLAAGDWTATDSSWFGGGALMIAGRHAAHAIWVMWDEAAEFAGWYVNLEEPRRRTSLGFDTTDMRWTSSSVPTTHGTGRTRQSSPKQSEVGLFASEQARAIRAEGERVFARVESWSPPFDDGWEHWRPDPDWPLPSLPEGWERL